MKNIKAYKDFVVENVWNKITPWDQVKNFASDLLKKNDEKPAPTPAASNVAKGDLIGQDLIQKYNPDCADEFKDKIIDISRKLGIANPNWLLLTIIKESNCNPKARNPQGSASGLIQFLDSTARSLGTTIEAIRGMNGVEQLEYVYKYYKPYAGKMNGPEDVYLVTFMPGYFNSRNDNSKVMASGSTANQNRIIDLNHDGQIRMGEFKEYVMAGIPPQYREALA